MAERSKALVRHAGLEDPGSNPTQTRRRSSIPSGWPGRYTNVRTLLYACLGLQVTKGVKLEKIPAHFRYTNTTTLGHPFDSVRAVVVVQLGRIGGTHPSLNGVGTPLATGKAGTPPAVALPVSGRSIICKLEARKC